MEKLAYLKTYGCQMNEHDSQRLQEILLQEQYSFINFPQQADLIIINTCSVRANPQNKVFSEIGRYRHLKQKNPSLIIIIAGCVAQQEGQQLLKRYPIIDLVIGPDYYFDLPFLLHRLYQKQRLVIVNDKEPIHKIDNFIPESALQNYQIQSPKSYLVITKGCNNFCAYCIVPYTRGREVSRPFENLIQEAKFLVEHGVKEITLLGQNVNSYQDNHKNFYDLLLELTKISALQRIRFISSHPKDWTNQLADLMAENPKICHHLHLPFQAGSDHIIQLMNRRHTIQNYLDKIHYLKQRIPRILFSTDLIVGFPGETEADFQQTLQVLNDVKFAQVYAFKYSVRPGTKAATFKDDVSIIEKKQRLEKVQLLQKKIQEQILQNQIGTEQEVLLDQIHSKDPSILIGRTKHNLIVNCYHANQHNKIGDLVKIKIQAAQNFILTAFLNE